MATKYATLKDSNGDIIYPQISTDSIANNSITSSKIDWTTITYAVTTPLGILRRNTVGIDYSYNLNNVGTVFGGTLGDGYYTYTAWVGNKGTGQPSTQTSGHLLVLSDSTLNQCNQIIFGGNILLIRKYNGTSWGSWTKITGTADS